MARYLCKYKGQKPDGTVCDAFDLKSWSCTAERCELRIQHLSDEEQAVFNQVVIPPEVQRLKAELERRPDLFAMLSDDVFKPVQSALAIIEQMSPIGKTDGPKSADGRVRTWADLAAYWDSPEWLERDMGMLGALHVQISTAAAKLEANYTEADEARKTIRARKYLAIKKSFAAGIRIGDKPTEEELKHLVRADAQMQDIIRTMLDTKASAGIMGSFAESMIEFINITKRRIDGFREERRYTGRA